jgi:hypothetical protein
MSTLLQFFFFLLASFASTSEAWYSGIHGPGTMAQMLLQCFDNDQIPCTPIKTIAAWYDQTSKRGIRASSSQLPVITYSSADGNDITTFLLSVQDGLIDTKELKLENATDINVYTFCCNENHVEGGTGDS